jgi:hypothetical protein
LRDTATCRTILTADERRSVEAGRRATKAQAEKDMMVAEVARLKAELAAQKKKKQPSSLGATMPTKKQLAELKQDITAAVSEGFSSRDDILDRFVEDPDEETYGELDEDEVERLVDAAILAHHRKQAKWTAPTDCDRLDVAFKALNRQGVVARQNFT